MAAPYHSLSNKCEAALIEAVSGLVAGYAELTGSSDATKTAPNIIATAESIGEENPILSGNYTVRCIVSVNTPVEEFSLATHRDNSATFFDALRFDDIAATLSASTVVDFHVFSVLQIGEDVENTDTQFQSSIVLDLYACSMDL